MRKIKILENLIRTKQKERNRTINVDKGKTRRQGFRRHYSI